MSHVLVPDYPIRVQYNIGVLSAPGQYPFSFTFFKNADITVYNDTVLMAEGTNYTLVGNPGNDGGFMGGTVTIWPGNNTTLTIIRSLPIERLSDFPDAGSFNRRTLNNTLDQHIAIMQQIDERVDRAVILPPTAPGTGLVANAFIQVNPSGTGWELIAQSQMLAEIGAQAGDPTLTGLAALAPTVANRIIVTTGADTFAYAPVTPYSLSLIDDPDAPTARTTLGLGTMATQNANNVAITGGTISGVAIAVPGLGTMSTQNANAVAITGGTITNMPTPSSASDVATKGYADNLAFGVNKRSTVRVASTANLTLAGITNGATVDGVVLVAGDRILVKDQTNHAENGVYVSGPVNPIRAADFDTYDECPGSLVTIQEGTVNQDTVYLCTSNSGGILGTTPIDFSKVKVSPNIPVVIAEGGTGQTTAAAAFDALKQQATLSYLGAMQQASQTEVNTGTDAAKAVTPVTLKAYLASVQIVGRPPIAQCRLVYLNNDWIGLERCNGMYLTVDDKPSAIPAGTAIQFNHTANAGSDGVWSIWAYGNPTVTGMAASTDVPIQDPRNGILIHPTQPTLTYVGCINRLFGAAEDSETVRHVSTYYNRYPRTMQYYQSNSTASGSNVPLHNPIRWIAQANSGVHITFSGYMVNNTGAVTSVCGIMLTGSAVIGGELMANLGASSYIPVSTNYVRPLTGAITAEIAQMCGSVTGGTMTLVGQINAIVH